MPDFLQSAQSWLQGHENFLLWLGVGSSLMLLLSIISMPWIASQIPEDYFLAEKRHRVTYGNWLVYLIVMIIKNAMGLIFLLLGIFMLFLPGPGLITLIVGIVLLNFPGKFKLEQWLISRPGVLKTINWLRNKRGKNPLLVDHH